MFAIIEQIGILKREIEIIKKKKTQIEILDLKRELMQCKIDKKIIHELKHEDNETINRKKF